MKKLLSMVLLAGLLAAPMYAVELDKVTAMAKASSGATLDALSLAVYETVKAEPQSAVDVFRGVMQQRSNWSATETYAILRSVLLASPELESSFVQGASQYQGSSQSSTALNSLGYQLVASLYTMSQTQAVASSVIQGVVGSAASGSGVGNGVSAAALDAFVPAPSFKPEYSVTPTPPPTSVNN